MNLFQSKHRIEKHKTFSKINATMMNTFVQKLQVSAIILVFSIIWSTSVAQPYLVKTFGTPVNDYPIGFIKDSDTTLLFCGWRSLVDGLLVKTNLLGDTIFTRTYPILDVVADFIKLNSEQYLIIDEGNNMVSISSDGTTNWQKTGVNSNYRRYIHSAAIAFDNHFVVAGEVDIFDHLIFVPDYGMDSVFQRDIYIALYNFEGELIQSDTIALSDNDDFLNDIIYYNNEYHIVGYSVNEVPNLYIARINSEFNLTCHLPYDYNYIFRPKSFVIDIEGNYILTGTKWLTSSHRLDMFLMKFDLEGGLIWQKYFNYTTYEYGFDEGAKVIQNLDGSISALGIVNNGSNTQQLLLTKVDAGGNLLVNELIDFPGHNTACSLMELDDNKIALYGCTNYNTQGNADLLYIVCDSLGNYNVGISDNNELCNTILYPNPTEGAFDVSAGSGKNIRGIAIFSVTGNLISEYKNVSSNHCNLSPDLKYGTYIVRIALSDENVIYKKLFIR